MVFKRNLNLEAAEKRQQLSAIELERGDKLRCLHGESLEAKVKEATALGLSGVFMRVGDEFIISNLEELLSECEQNKKYYNDRAHWSEQKRERVRKVRYFICALALAGMSLAVMSRLMLNVSVVDMVRKVHLEPARAREPRELAPGELGSPGAGRQRQIDSIASAESARPLVERLGPSGRELEPAAGGVEGGVGVEQFEEVEREEEESAYVSKDGLTFNWSKRQVNFLLGSIFIGVPFGVLVMGDLVERLGAKWPMLAALAFTALVNMLTPSIARANFNLLVASRASLGFVQGALLPAHYELFNRWLTKSEAAIFAPMIKVSGPIGALIGVIVPGLMAAHHIKWPLIFMLGAFCCFAWSAVWLYFATSAPQTNRLVEAAELDKIMRKKRNLELATVESCVEQQQQQQQQQQQRVASCNKQPQAASAPNKGPTPWLAIIACPSVWALTLVKLSYLSGIDFVYIILPNYLSSMFAANTETISLVFTICFSFQLILLSPTSWLAQWLVARRALGLSVTKWRKLFQGAANFLMAALYASLAFAEPRIELCTLIVVLICVVWMLGAGGEAMVPYDLSTKFPASIVALSHSISVSSGILISLVCNLVVGENAAKQASWRPFFLLLAAGQTFGGLVFCLLLKAKPFLLEERVTLARPKGTANDEHCFSKD